jgi:hypothetical protein
MDLSRIITTALLSVPCDDDIQCSCPECGAATTVDLLNPFVEEDADVR